VAIRNVAIRNVAWAIRNVDVALEMWPSEMWPWAIRNVDIALEMWPLEINKEMWPSEINK